MNQSQIYTLARNAGLPAARAKIAAAIAMAESGGNPAAVVHDSDDDSYGLWQINMRGSMGPTRRALYGLASNDALLDPATNARVMSSISHQGANFSAWTTYTSGKYKDFMGVTVSEIAGDVAGGVLGGVGGALLPDGSGVFQLPADVVDAFHKIATGMEKTAGWVSNQRNWLRVAYVVGGGVLLYAAVETLVLPYTSKAVGKVMGVASPVARTAKKIGASS